MHVTSFFSIPYSTQHSFDGSTRLVKNSIQDRRLLIQKEHQLKVFNSQSLSQFLWLQNILGNFWSSLMRDTQSYMTFESLVRNMYPHCICCLILIFWGVPEYAESERVEALHLENLPPPWAVGGRDLEENKTDFCYSSALTSAKRIFVDLNKKDFGGEKIWTPDLPI